MENCTGRDLLLGGKCNERFMWILFRRIIFLDTLFIGDVNRQYLSETRIRSACEKDSHTSANTKHNRRQNRQADSGIRTRAIVHPGELALCRQSSQKQRLIWC